MQSSHELIIGIGGPLFVGRLAGRAELNDERLLAPWAADSLPGETGLEFERGPTVAAINFDLLVHRIKQPGQNRIADNENDGHLLDYQAD